MADEKENDSHDIELTPFNVVRYALSIGLLIFSIILVGALMFTGNTRVADEAGPWVAIIVCVSGRRRSTRSSLILLSTLDVAHVSLHLSVLLSFSRSWQWFGSP
jgi:hypothetical protein